MSAIRAERRSQRPRPVNVAMRVLMLGIALCACASLTGCDRNSATPYLVPTGIRPPLLNPSGGVYGVLHFGPAQRPDLANAPYPPTRVDLLRGRDSSLVTGDSLATSEHAFRFTGVQPGPYLVRAVTRGFTSPLVRVTVIDRLRDAGDLTLPMAPSVYSAFIGLIGTMPGYDYDSYYSNIFNSPLLGFYSYPSDFHAEGAVLVPAGTHEFMFVTDNSFADDLIGWGGDSAELLTIPLLDHRTSFSHGPAHNLKVNFPVTGNYNFSIDEARQTFSVTLSPAAQSAQAPRSLRRTR